MSPKSSLAPAGLAVILCLAAPSTAWEVAVFTVPLGERQLFLDDAGIAQMEGLIRTMHQPVKKGAVIRPDYLQRGEHHLQIRNAPNWDRERQVFRFLLTGTSGRQSISTVWESRDGLHWTRAGRSDMVIYAVVYDPTDPDPARRYKSISPRRVAVSPDMLTWTSLGNPRIPASDEYNLSFDEKGGLFILTVKRGGPYGRSHALLTNERPENFEEWKDHGLLFHADARDQEEGRDAIKALMVELVADPRLEQTDFYAEGNYVVDIYNTPVFRYESHYLALPAIHPSITMDLNDPSDNIAFKIPQLMCSRDLSQWRRLGDRQDFIGLSRTESGAYDLCVAFPPSSPVVRGDELWFYYEGVTDIGWPPKTGFDLERRDWKHYRPDRGAICLAVLRRDGFISLDAGERTGRVLTRPFTVPGPSLRLNADAWEGEVRVEVIDEDGRIAARSEPVSGDQPAAEVVWQEGNISGLESRTVQLRFELRQARLYAFWFE